MPTVVRSLYLALKTLPTEQLNKARSLLQSCLKLRKTDSQAVLRLWELAQRIYTDSDLIKAVFVASDGSLEALKAVAEGFSVYGEDLLDFIRRQPRATPEQISNAGKAVKCLNDANLKTSASGVVESTTFFRDAIANSDRALATVMDEIAAIIKGGTNAAEKIDPATLVSMLQKLTSRPNQIGYKVTHFTNHLATLLSKNPSIQSLLSKAPGSSSVCLVDKIVDQMDAPAFGVLGGHLLHLQEAAKLAHGGQTISFLEKSGGQFMDIVLHNDSRFYEVKLSFQTLVGKEATSIPSLAARFIRQEISTSGLDPDKLVYVIGRGYNGQFDVISQEVITKVQKKYPGVQFESVAQFPSGYFSTGNL